jgi:hypothetical protein
LRTVVVTLSLVVVGIAAGCASVEPPRPAVVAGSPEDIQALRERARAYWAARVAKDLKAQYEMLEPRARARVEAGTYGRERIVEYVAAQVEDVNVAGSFGRVSVRMLVRVHHPLLGQQAQQTRSSVGQDHWVRIRGTWYRSLEAEVGAPEPWPVPGAAGG